MIQSDSYNRFKEFLNGGKPTFTCVSEFEETGIGVWGEIIYEEFNILNSS